VPDYDYARKESKVWSQAFTIEVDGFVYGQARAYNCGPLMTLTNDGFAHLIAYVGTTTSPFHRTSREVNVGRNSSPTPWGRNLS
jgi:hypothetical protein